MLFRIRVLRIVVLFNNRSINWEIILFIDESELYTKCSDFGQHNTLTLEEKTFHYFEVGDASKPLVLFLHGFPQVLYK